MMPSAGTSCGRPQGSRYTPHGSLARRKILFFLPSLAAGGAEMHGVRLGNHVDPEKFEVVLAVGRGGPLEDRVADHLRLHVLTSGAGDSSLLRLVRSFRPLKELIEAERPDLVCSFLEHPGLLAYSAVRYSEHHCPIVVGVQNTMSQVWDGNGLRAALGWITLRAVGYAYTDVARVVALSHGVAADVGRLLPRLRDRLHVIYNAGYDDRVCRDADEAVERPAGGAPLFVACGRLAEQKDFSTLIRAFAEIQPRSPSHLWIMGEGPLREELEALALDRGVSDRVRFLGFQTNPYKYMASADVFVLSSRYEGFANVVVEAMACGTPVVSTDCPHGPGEILGGGRGGILVPPGDSQALADAMARLALNSGERATLAQKGRRRAADFHARSVALEYERLFQDVFRDLPRRTTSVRESAGEHRQD